MKKTLIFGVMLGLFFGACDSQSGSSTKVDTSASCHTCFKLDKAQEEAKQKAAHSPKYRFALSDVAVFSADGKQEIGTMIKGYGGEILQELGDKVLLEVKGFTKEGDSLHLYSAPDSELATLRLTQPAGELPLKVAVKKSELSESEGEVWSKAEFIYYDNCSMCHAAHAPKEHTIQEWEGIYGTMKAFAMPTEENDALIWEYLQAHANDSFALDDEQ